MSLPCGVGDIVLVANFVWRLYKSSKDASEDFRRMSIELLSLHAILCQTREYLEEHGNELSDAQKNGLCTAMDGCQSSLQDLAAMYRRYDSLGTQAQRAWDRMRFGLKDFSDIRQRLISSTTLLTGLHTALNNSTNARVGKLVIKFIMEWQAGMREGSVVDAPDVRATIKSPEGWAELRRELEDVGISVAVAEERRDFIVDQFQNAAAEGSFDLDDASNSSRSTTPTNGVEPDWHTAASDLDDASNSSRSTAPTNDIEPDWHTAASDFSDDSSELGTISYRRAAMSTATREFEAEVQSTLNERSSAELFDPLAAASTYSLSLPSTSTSSFQTARSSVRRQRAISLVQRLFQKPTAIVKAASDNDIDRVARLIRLGVDVNAVDRWGWSALSMCAYGGHMAIARLLLDHGAKIDNRDVDDDTPKSLAEHRGHANLWLMLEEEESKREIKAREAKR
ncbi:hypothetical protein B0H19DRAFT_966398 [Mycena capillaripes]|nr:hypothetical protein B0H19DRAFT_966398 [Mycena capillaripes]